MQTNNHHIAQCCCGDFKINIEGEPKMHGLCHCTDCKKRTGSGFGISSYFSPDSIKRIEGENNCYTLFNEEQNHEQKRYFCKNCGSTLYWTISDRADIIGIAGGNIINGTMPEPSYSVNDSQRCQWLQLPKTWVVQP